jgi:hypothetical protein
MCDKSFVTIDRILRFLLYPGYILLEEFSGEGRWYRRQRRRMLSDRPPLSDNHFLRAAHVPSVDAPLWLAIRRAVAAACGIPAVAVYPRDHLQDLLRMLSPVPDLFDFIYPLEKELDVTIPREMMRPALAKALREGRMEELGQFAAVTVRVLRALPSTTEAERNDHPQQQ